MNYNHLCKGNKCFRHDCEKPQYVDCLHPPVHAIVNDELTFVDGVLYDECRSCQYKKSQLLKKEVEKWYKT